VDGRGSSVGGLRAMSEVKMTTEVNDSGVGQTWALLRSL
jgi:hypothetical protein